MTADQTFGFSEIKDMRNECATPCLWVMIQHGLACCEFDKPGFPAAQGCEKFEAANEAL